MIDHEQRVSAALRAVGDDVRIRPTLVADVLAGAVRRRRRRRAAGGAACTVAIAVAVSVIAAGGLRPLAGPDHPVGTPEPSASASAPPLPPAPKSCQIDRLPIPGGEPASIVTGGDPTGRYLVGRAYGSTGHVERHPLLIWDNGRPTSVDMPGNDESFDDINSSGVAVGNSFNTSEIRDGKSAYVYRDGQLTRLHAPAAFVDARGIGEDGTIVGSVRDGLDAPDRPLVWRDPARPEQFDLPSGFASGAAVDIDADGTIVGSVSRTDLGDPQGYIWKPDGTGQLLPMPEIDGKPVQGWSPDHVHNGVVVGHAVVRAGTRLSNDRLLFDLRTGKFTMLTQTFGDVGNSMGWLLATANPPFVSTPTGQVTLPPLATNGDLTGRGVFVSENGLVIGGQSNDDSGQMQAVRWRCT